MRIALDVRDLAIASWETDADSVARVAPPGVEAALVDGRHLVSVVAFRVRGGRLGRLPVPPYSQLNVRTYVTWRGEPAVLFVAARVTAAGLGGVLLGAPYRLARLRVRPREVRAGGLGLALRFRTVGPGSPGAVGRHDLGLFEANGALRSFRIVRGEAAWERAEPVPDTRADVLLGFGFATCGEPEVAYAARASFRTEPPLTVRR